MKIQFHMSLLCQVTTFALVAFHGVMADKWMPKPKMNARAIMPGEASLLANEKRRLQGADEIVKSKVAYFIGTCSSTLPFKFPIGGNSGRGSIGFDSTSKVNEDTLSLSFVGKKEKNSDISTMNDKVGNDFFGSIGENKSSLSFHGIPFKYEGITSKDLSMVQLTCPDSKNPMDVIIIVSDNDEEYAQAKIISGIPGSDTIEVELLNSEASSDLAAVPLKKGLTTFAADRGAEAQTFAFENPKPDDGKIQAAKNECSIVQAVLTDSNDQNVPRSLVVCSDEKSSSVRAHRKLLSNDNGGVNVDSAEIDTNGDIAIDFASLHSSFDAESSSSDEIVKFDVRIGINSKCNDETIEVVDMSAMLLASKPTMIVNGSWFRRARELHEIKDSCEWEPVVMDAVVTDPESKYSYLAHLSTPTEVKVMTGVQSHGNAHRKLSMDELGHRRSLLTARASLNEMNITTEMSVGRKPESMYLPSTSSSSESRNLASSPAAKRLCKKILVHGYCSLGVWPMAHFTDAIEFSDPDTIAPVESSWSHNQFALKIDKFANDNDIVSCGIIAHSQGGLASLHLKDNYWSCLDNAQDSDLEENGGRLIQSVGSPYQGTPLAGNLAAIGNVFGVGMYEETE